MIAVTTASPSEGSLPFLLQPWLFRSIERLCRDVLAVSPVVRQEVITLYQNMRGAALMQYGADTVDVKALGDLLHRTDPRWADRQLRPDVQLDPLDALRQRTPPAIDNDQLQAALRIRAVRNGWGRNLKISGSSYQPMRGKTARSRSVGPIDGMSEEMWDHWRTIYCEWHNAAAHRMVKGRNHQQLPHSAIVLWIVEAHFQPKALDRAWHIGRGKALDILQTELQTYAGLMKLAA